MNNLKDSIGFTENGPAIASPAEENRLREFVNLKLATRGHAIIGDEKDYPFLELGRSFIANFQEKSRLLADYLCPADAAIDGFLRDYLGAEIVAKVFPDNAALVPRNPLQLERHGIARMLSLPPDQDEFKSTILSSYRVFQGVCHNPASDRRTFGFAARNAWPTPIKVPPVPTPSTSASGSWPLGNCDMSTSCVQNNDPRCR